MYVCAFVFVCVLMFLAALHFATTGVRWVKGQHLCFAMFLGGPEAVSKSINPSSANLRPAFFPLPSVLPESTTAN